MTDFILQRGVAPSITFETSWTAYLKMRPVYPALPSAAPAPLIISDIQELADAFDAFVFDAYGVLNVGDQPIAGMPAFVRSLQRQQKAVCILSNGASFDKPYNVAKFATLGYGLEAADIFSSRDIFLLHNPSIRYQSERCGIAPSAHNNTASLHVNALEPADNPELYEPCDRFIIVSTAQWNPRRHQHMRDALLKRPRPLSVLNPDITAPFPDRYNCEPGYYAYLIQRDTGIQAEYFGKPFPEAFQAVWEHLQIQLPGIQKNKVVMIGDTPQTDILGGRAIGFKTLLMADHGLFREQNYVARIEECEISPDYILTERKF